MDIKTAISKIETEFASAMDLEAGKGIKIRTLFNALKKLEKGEFKTMKEMHEKFGFAAQNVTFKVILKMLENEGVNLKELSGGRGKKKLGGTDFALELLKQKGLKIK